MKTIFMICKSFSPKNKISKEEKELKLLDGNKDKIDYTRRN